MKYNLGIIYVRRREEQFFNLKSKISERGLCFLLGSKETGAIWHKLMD